MLSSLVAWFAEPGRWSGSTGVPARLAQHLGYTVLAVAIAAVIAVPIGAVVGHTRRGRFAVVGAANGLRALPELGVLILLALLLGVGLLPATLALVLLAIPPLLAGTYAGVAGVDPAAVDAARGMGMRAHQVLLRVELPNALPLVVGGLRLATLQVIATAVIGAYVSLGGLGRYIIDGQAVRDFPQMLGGAVLIAALAIVVELLLQGVARLVTPGRPLVRQRSDVATRSTTQAVEPEIAHRETRTAP